MRSSGRSPRTNRAKAVTQETRLWDEKRQRDARHAFERRRARLPIFSRTRPAAAESTAEFIDAVKRRDARAARCDARTFMRRLRIELSRTLRRSSQTGIWPSFSKRRRGSRRIRRCPQIGFSAELTRELNNSGKTVAGSPGDGGGPGRADQDHRVRERSITIRQKRFWSRCSQPARPRGGDQEKGFEQISDSSAIEKIVDEIIAANQNQVTAYRGGNEKLFGFFVGQVMKARRARQIRRSSTLF